MTPEQAERYAYLRYSAGFIIFVFGVYLFIAFYAYSARHPAMTEMQIYQHWQDVLAFRED